MPRQFAGILSLTLLAVAACGSAAMAITVKIDYSTDTGGFFGSGNPGGATAGGQAKAALQAAAEFYSGILDDSFSAIDVPDKFVGSQGGQATWFWKTRFANPTTGLNNAALNVEVAANDFVVFAGARDLPGDELGRGGAGGFVGGFFSQSGQFTGAETAQLNSMKTEFAAASTKRGETSGFGRWGGSIAFDTPRTWHFNHTTSPGAGTNDFYSVALHELGHALGLGASDEWTALVSGTGFTGANALTSYVPAGNVPLASSDDKGHWLQGIAASGIYEGSGTQTPLMVPTLGPATRRLLTNLDAAALADLGWEIDLPGGASAASFAAGGDVGGSQQFAAFMTSAVPEPTSVVLWLIAAAFASQFKSRSRRVG